MNATAQVFVVRLWLEPRADGSGAWRASVLNPQSKRRRYFTDPQALSQFLQEFDLNWPFDPDEPPPSD